MDHPSQTRSIEGGTLETVRLMSQAMIPARMVVLIHTVAAMVLISGCKIIPPDEDGEDLPLLINDSFNEDQSFLMDGTDNSNWDGVANVALATIADANMSNTGALTLESAGGTWDASGGTGPFLYKEVQGDFIAEVEVLDADDILHHDVGLLVRTRPAKGTGNSEDWIALRYYVPDNLNAFTQHRRRPTRRPR